MSFGAIVKLYRLCGMPSIEGGDLSVDVAANPEIFEALATVHRFYGDSFKELFVDGREYLPSDEIRQSGSHIEFTFSLPADSDSKLYESVDELIASSGKVCKGSLPEFYYIRSLNYFNAEDEPPDEIKTLISVCKVVELLSTIAHYHDQKTVSDSHKLVFINPDESSEKPAIVLETRIDKKLVNRKPLSYQILEDLAHTDYSSDPHLVAKKGVFWSSLAEFSSKFEDEKRAFSNLIENWESFLTLYQNNLETYLSGFAFHKAKREVAQTELDLASNFSKVIGDITGKLLAIPVSFGALLVIGRTDSFFEQVTICIGLFLGSILIVGVVDNQQRQLRRISHAKSVVLGSFEGKKDRYPLDLQKAVSDMVNSLGSNEKNLGKTLYFFRFLAWLPFIISVVTVLVVNSVN